MRRKRIEKLDYPPTLGLGAYGDLITENRAKINELIDAFNAQLAHRDLEIALGGHSRQPSLRALREATE